MTPPDRFFYPQAIAWKGNAAGVFIHLLTFSLLIAFVVWYVGQERYIYFWDYATYHTVYRDLGKAFEGSLAYALRTIGGSVRHFDYNHLAPSFLMPFYFVFGSGRLAYILSVTVAFALPAIVLFVLLIEKLTVPHSSATTGNRIGITIISIAVLALMPQFWVPVLDGYVDVVGVNVIFLILLLYLRTPLVDQRIPTLIVIGVCLSGLIILRRWYAYWIVGFILAVSVQAAWETLRAYPRLPHVYVALRNVLVIGLTALICFFTVATPIAVRMVVTDYGDLYSAYKQSESLPEHVERLYAHFGPIVLLLAALGAVTLAFSARRRPWAVLLGVTCIVSFVLFTNVQDMGYHHYYSILPILAIFIAVFLVEIYARFTAAAARIAVVATLIALSVSSFLVVLSPAVQRSMSRIQFAFPQLRSFPKTRDDLAEFHRMLLVLDELTRDSMTRVYVLASGWTLNSSLVKNGCYAFEPALHALDKRIMYSNDVDKRDGFPYQFLEAKYIVLTDPVSYHLAPNDQRIIGELSRLITDEQALGRSYRKLDFEFALDNGIKAYIYEKWKAFDAEEIESTSAVFMRFYPNIPEKFTIEAGSVSDPSGI